MSTTSSRRGSASLTPERRLAISPITTTSPASSRLLVSHLLSPGHKHRRAKRGPARPSPRLTVARPVLCPVSLGRRWRDGADGAEFLEAWGDGGVRRGIAAVVVPCGEVGAQRRGFWISHRWASAPARCLRVRRRSCCCCCVVGFAVACAACHVRRALMSSRLGQIQGLPPQAACPWQAIFSHKKKGNGPENATIVI